MIKINLLHEAAPAKPIARTTGTGLLAALLLALLAVGFAACCWTWHLNRIRSELLIELNLQQIEQERLAVIRTQVDRFSRQKAQLDSRISLIESLVANQSHPVELMNDLIGAIPAEPQLWLEKVAQGGKRVTIEGQALDVPSVAQFIVSLNQTAAFPQVDLEFWEEDAGSIRFQLSCIMEST